MTKILQKLSEGMVSRDLQREGAAMLRKWDRTGLLEGLKNDRERQNMAVLLENQTRELLREATSMAGGDVEGFASVAFPIVRRVFGNLIANDLVSVQPMSLPSGLIFFLDFTYDRDRLGQKEGESIYGQGVVGREIIEGVSLDGENAEKSAYNMNNGYSSAVGETTHDQLIAAPPQLVAANVLAYGEAGGANEALNKLIKYDVDLLGKTVTAIQVDKARLTDRQFHEKNLVAITGSGQHPSMTLVRRLSHIKAGDKTKIVLVFEIDPAVADAPAAGADFDDAQDNVAAALTTPNALKLDFPINDNLVTGGALGSVVGSPLWGLEGTEEIPELDLKINSEPITAVTKKLKAKWTPEVGQDLNAYHNLDAEVELTSVLAEHIELEIDREILEDLIKGATCATKYWSRRPGKFVNADTGADISGGIAPPDFTGNVSEWYETLIERINDVSAVMHRKLRKGGANFIVCSPEAANILEFTAGFRGNVVVGEDKGTAGAQNVGSVNKKFDVYVDPYFPRQVILVGRRGSSFLESGYVYAPYVPLMMTPTIFGTEDFVPRKGVMTRYGKKMVRPDMYGLVIIQDMIG